MKNSYDFLRIGCTKYILYDYTKHKLYAYIIHVY